MIAVIRLLKRITAIITLHTLHNNLSCVSRLSRWLVQALTRTPYTTHPQKILKLDLSYWPIYL